MHSGYTDTMRDKVIRFRIAGKWAAACKGAAHASGKTLSAWFRGLANAEIQRLEQERKTTATLPRSRWCSSCNQRPLACTTFKEGCPHCTLAEQELRS